MAAVSGKHIIHTSKAGKGLFPAALTVWELVYQSLVDHVPVMLMYVLESNGSSPGRQGFSMAVNAAGTMAGSIGGGIMEHKFVEMAKQQLLSRQDKDAVIRRQFHDKTVAKDQSGMICSGDQTILMYPVPGVDLDAVEKIISYMHQHRNAIISFSPAGLAVSEGESSKEYSFIKHSDKDWQYREKLGYKQHLYIVGGGHCSLALSKLMSDMDFYIHLFDDRTALNTFDENVYVHEKTIVADYSELNTLIPSGENNYVVVMSFGYRTDDIAIRALLNHRFRYFGVLGSVKKMEKLFSDYIAEGIDEALIKQIQAPVGVPINSQTPAEIAVSIAAGIIQVKNQSLTERQCQ